MSRMAASQNHSMSPSARFNSSANVSIPCRSMKRLRRLRSTTSGLGRQMTSPITTGCTGCLRVPTPFNCHRMARPELPDDFADDLARVLEPGQHDAAAEIIEAATMLDDVGLRRFLQLFAARARSSAAPITADELRVFVQQAAL